MITEPPTGGRFAESIRDGDTLTRRMGPGAVNIHALLRHLEHRGFGMSPRVVGTTADGQREVLTYLPGSSAYPPLPPQCAASGASTRWPTGPATTPPRRREPQ